MRYDRITRPTRILVTVLVIVMSLIFSMFLTACSNTPASTTAATTKAAAGTTAATTKAATSATTVVATTVVATTVAEKKFTATELATFDGKDGRKAYIAVDGVVYDVTAIAAWGAKMHAGKFQAGKDYSAELKSAPHGIDKLLTAVKVGVLSK